jgi:hypothetical protein
MFRARNKRHIANAATKADSARIEIIHARLDKPPPFE